MNAVPCIEFILVKYPDAGSAGMSLEVVTVSSIMTRNVKTAKETQTVSAAAKLMSEMDIGSVIIVKSSNAEVPVGIVTERDIIRLLAKRGGAMGLTLREAMSKPLITIGPESSMQDAIQTMHAKNIRRLPVVKGEKMVGIITNKDIFRAIMKNQTLAASILGAAVVTDYRPMYERLSSFMLGEMLLPFKDN